ncbi:MAG TPA: response regulator transcription factor [Patescibacteria group bacterium]|jgi:DNA-binding response OmpR family regulator|nr:response regulator transcription factor [Patescibacteria group bacterium]
MKILVVEDEHRIAQALKQGLSDEGYAVDVAYDGDEGVRSAESDEYDLIIMDVMMPVLDGVQASQKLRADGNHTPILMLTAKSQPRDIVTGLDAGADDYLPKPFSFDVLLARVRALLRRPNETLDTILSVDDLELDVAKHSVTRGGVPLQLSGKEYAILEYLLRNKDRILSKNNIISHVWDFDADVLPNNVEVFITYLRNKVDRPFPKARPLIQTVRGFGYVIKDEPA